MMGDQLTIVPPDADVALLIGRVWDPETQGPRPVRVAGNAVHDLFDIAPTVSDLLEQENAVDIVRSVTGEPRWVLSDLVDASMSTKRHHRAHLLAPTDLQVVKACGVTFVDSMIERVIEERCEGDAVRAAEIRSELGSALAEIKTVEPGSAAAAEVKRVFSARGIWSQYLEVGLGPDPEVFTKAPLLASVGYGTRIGIPSFSSWNNPEPELVLVADSAGRPRGATLGNDVNLRDIEGRSALLLGMAKDNNASSAIGPFVRLFDDSFTLDTVRSERISLRVEGRDDEFLLEGENNVARLSRSLESLLAATIGEHHQYPDGFVLYTGTLFAPALDRDVVGSGFTHKIGDQVTISSPHLGTLSNMVERTEQLPPWEFGVRALMRYIAAGTRIAA